MTAAPGGIFWPTLSGLMTDSADRAVQLEAASGAGEARALLAELADADLAGCDFRDAVFNGGSLRNANLKGARFENADLREANLGGLKLSDVKLFQGALISTRQAAEVLAEMGLRVG